jgi:hypothetical protein
MGALRVLFCIVVPLCFVFGTLRGFRRGYYVFGTKYQKEGDKFHLSRTDNPGLFWSFVLLMTGISATMGVGGLWLIFHPDFEPCVVWPGYFRCRA